MGTQGDKALGTTRSTHDMDVHLRSHLPQQGLMPCWSLIRLDGTSRRNSKYPTTSRCCSCHRGHPN